MCATEWLGGVVGFLSGAAVAVFAEPVRQRLFRPNIQFSFGSSDAAFVARTPELMKFPDGRQVASEAIYIRLKVQNSRGEVARSCRGYLVSVERKSTGTSMFEPAPFYDPVRIAWSSRMDHAYDAIDLPRGLHHFLDVLSTRPLDTGFRLETQFKPFREGGLGRESGEYKLTILVGGDNFPTTTTQLVVQWTGAWDTVRVMKL